MPYDYPRLMGLRWVLALCVLAYHITPLVTGLLPGTSLLYDVLSYGWLAVDAFFILSGFIITHHYGGSLQAFDWEHYKHFLWQRLARLYPLHITMLLVLLIMVTVAMLLHVPLSMENYQTVDFIQNILLIQAWHLPDHLDWNHPAWAISIEWLLYLLAPVLFKLLLRPRPQWLALLLAKVSLFLMPLAMLILPWDTHIAYSVIRGICGFMAGLFLYQYLFGRNWVLLYTQWLASQPARRLGQASYALYMVQYPVLLVMSHHSIIERLQDIPAILKALYIVAVLGMIFAATYVAHRFIEEPARQSLKRLYPFKR